MLSCCWPRCRIARAMDPRREPAPDVAPARHRREVVELLEEPQLERAWSTPRLNVALRIPPPEKARPRNSSWWRGSSGVLPGASAVGPAGAGGLAGAPQELRSARRTSSKVKPFGGVVTSRSPRPMRRPPAATPRSRCLTMRRDDLRAAEDAAGARRQPSPGPGRGGPGGRPPLVETRIPAAPTLRSVGLDRQAPDDKKLSSQPGPAPTARAHELRLPPPRGEALDALQDRPVLDEDAAALVGPLHRLRCCRGPWQGGRDTARTPRGSGSRSGPARRWSGRRTSSAASSRRPRRRTAG